MYNYYLTLHRDYSCNPKKRRRLVLVTMPAHPL